ncbi:MAG TPA: 50S ribosomal protein L25 [Saprospiraceae bacterium]|nr:50S ribosomal protein L25 [Saprospiraceae bacterium]
MESIVVNGSARPNLGKTGAKVIRNEGSVPCVLYSSEGVVHFSTTPLELRDLIYSPDFKVANISVEGATHRCILKAVQFHPVTDAIVHVDFLKLLPGQKIKVEVPLRFVGASPGVKAGGKLIQLVRRIKVKATPEDMVDEVVADISGLELGQSIRVREIKSNEGIEIMNSPSIPVGMIEIPRALRSAAAAAEKSGK